MVLVRLPKVQKTMEPSCVVVAKYWMMAVPPEKRVASATPVRIIDSGFTRCRRERDRITTVGIMEQTKAQRERVKGLAKDTLASLGD